MTDPRDLIKRLAEELNDLHCHYNVPNQSALIAEARAYLEETAPVLAKEQRPDRLIVGDIWEFETEVWVKGKRKLQAVTLQWEVKGFHHGECAWQLQSLDEQHYVYLWGSAPQYEEMTYIGTKKSA